MTQPSESLEIVESPADPDLDEIIRGLNESSRKLPKQAILSARDHRERIIPRLIQAIEHATAETEAGNPVEGNAHGCKK